jgi:hypothetical protein
LNVRDPIEFFIFPAWMAVKEWNVDFQIESGTKTGSGGVLGAATALASLKPTNR